MSYLNRLAPRRMGSYLSRTAIPTAEYAAASYAFGYLQNRYRDKAQVWKVPLDLAAGVAFKVASLVAGSGLSDHMDRIGSAGIGAYFHTLGAGAGAKASGVVRFMVPKSEEGKAKALPGVTVMGEIPQAPHGDYLSASELAAMAR